MKKVKVLFFIPGFAGGGAEKQCAFLANALARRDDLDISLLHFHEGINFPLLDRDWVKAIRIHTNSNYDPRNIWRVLRVFRAEMPDIVLSWLHASDVFTWGARLLGGRFSWLMMERNSSYPLDPRFLLRGVAGRFADMIISNSAQGDHYWEARGVPAHRRMVADNILPEEWLSAHSTVRQPIVCYAGRLEVQKNIPLVSAAFSELAKRRPDLRFAIIGEGSMADSVRQETAGIHPASLSILPFQKDIGNFFRKVSVFVNVSFHEGKPNTVIENLALGNRVVLSRIPEHIELVGADYPFLVATDIQPGQLAEVIEQALGSPVDVDEHARMLEKLSTMKADRVAARYATLFHQVVGQGA